MGDAYTQTMMPSAGATAVRLHYATRDRKLAPVVQGAYSGNRHRPMPQRPYCSATYVSIEATCPDSCRFKAAGCYVRAGFTGRAARQLDDAAAAEGLRGDEVIEREAQVIEASFCGARGRAGGRVAQDGGRHGRAGRDLRLHVGGDVSSTWGAMRLAVAAKSWQRRGGGAVWTYTHRWRRVARDAFGPISVLASVERVEDARAAVHRGYVPAIVLERFPSPRAFQLRGSRVTWLPCPAETKGTTCVQCRLCLDADALRRRGQGIAFAVHGNQAGKVQLPVVR